MPSLQIRKLPADVYEALRYRAEREGRSLAQQALAELRKMDEVGARERRRDILAAIRERIQRHGTRELEPTPEELIREDRGR